MRIALIGARGQLGTALQTALDGEIVPLGHDEIEITAAAGVESVLSPLNVDVVINTAAYNFVDRAEEETERAFAVNALGPRNLARFCAERDIPLIHFSTDYVFSGVESTAELHLSQRTPYGETVSVDPPNVYAVSKLAGEQFVRSICPRHFVVRTCGLYGAAGDSGKGNFVKTMLKLAREGGDVRVIDDQWCTPTSANDLAEWTSALVASRDYGLYHATNSGGTTWCRFAREVFRLANIDVTVHSITTEEYAAAARRPGYSVLDCRKMQRLLNMPFRSWEAPLADYVQSLTSGPTKIRERNGLP